MGVDLAAVSPWVFVVAPLAVIAAYVVLGLSGFGSTVISVPILAHFLPITYLVPLMVLLDLASAASIGRRDREHVAVAELKWLAPFMFAGFAIGVTVLMGAPDRILRAALGVFAVIVGLHGILNPVPRRRISRLWAVPAGVAGGAIATIFGAGGPIYASYLSGRLGDKREIRSTASTLISISAFSRAIIYAVTGFLLHKSIFLGLVALAPFAWIGLRIGGRIHVGLTNEQMRRVVGCVLLASGASLLARAALAS